MESKSEEKDDFNGDAIIEELVKFTNTTNYLEKVQSFMSRNCFGFETYLERQASGEGNKLEWMELFHQYQELIDDELGRFCQLNDAEPANIAEMIERYVATAKDDDFVPIFLKTMNEEHFFEQMCACALESSREEAVRETLAHEEKGETSMSGLWRFVPDSTDPDDLKHWLDVLGMPWPFKKLFLSAHKKPMKAVIRHVPAHEVEINIGIPLFGNVNLKATLDGQWCKGRDRVGRPMKLLGVEGDHGDVTIHVRDSGGSLMLMFLSMTGPTSISVYREFYISGEEVGKPDATLACSFRQ